MKIIKKINSVALVVLPILRVYMITTGLTLSYLIELILIVLNFGSIAASFRKDKLNFSFFIGILIIGLISQLVNSIHGEFSIYLSNLFVISLFFFTLILLTNNCDTEFLKKVLLLSGLVVTGICSIQFYQLLSRGYFDNFYIPGFDLYRANDIEEFRRRPYSVFSEPAHLAIYLLPLVYLSYRKKRYPLFVFFSLGVLLSGSTTGLIALFAIILVSVDFHRKNMIWIVLSIFAVIFIMNNLSSEYLGTSIDKLKESESNNIRLLGAIEYIKFFEPFNYIFGVGFNQVDNFLRMHGFFLVSNGVKITGNYAPALLYMFICHGIVGFLFFIWYLNRIYKLSMSNKGFFVVLMCVLCSDQVLFNENLMFVLACTILSDKLLSDANVVSVKKSVKIKEARNYKQNFAEWWKDGNN